MNQQNTGSGESGLSGLGAKSHEAAEQLKHSIVGQAEQVRDRAKSVKEDTAERIRRVASQVRSVGETLRPDDSFAASLADRASQSMEGIARYVGAADARSLIHDAEQLARRQPAAFFGGAFLLGLAAGRFLKSSGGGNVAQARPNGSEGRDPAWQPGAATGERARNGQPAPLQPSAAPSKSNLDATFSRDADALRDANRSTSGAAPVPSTSYGIDRDGNGGRGKGVTP